MLNIPLYEGTTFHLPIHQLIEIRFYFGHHESMLLRTLAYSVCVDMFSIVLGIYLGVELPSSVAIYLSI